MFQKKTLKSNTGITRRMTRFIFRHGLRENLEKINLFVGEPAYCEDTQELFIGTGDGFTKINIKGEKGDKGETGVQGPVGPKGDIGNPGRDGKDGERGPKGDTGATGERGLDGAQGPEGPAGRDGRDGRDGTGVNIQGARETENDLPNVANPGDAYLISGDLYVWNNESFDWVNVGTIQGPKGEQGERGATGPQGERGLKGDMGPQGPQGQTGLRGDKGEKGDPGERGQQGIPGKDAAAYIDDNTIAANKLWSSGKTDSKIAYEIEQALKNYAMIDDDLIVTNKVWSSGKTSAKIKYEIEQLKLSLGTGGDFVNKNIKAFFVPGITRETYPPTPQKTITAINDDNLVELCVKEQSSPGSLKIVVDGVILYDDYASNLFVPIVIPFKTKLEIYQKGVGGFTSGQIRCVHYYK